jgi:hypothetical protein
MLAAPNNIEVSYIIFDVIKRLDMVKYWLCFGRIFFCFKEFMASMCPASGAQPAFRYTYLVITTVPSANKVPLKTHLRENLAVWA